MRERTSLAEHPGLIVQKYGGSSLATAERIRAAARRVSRTAQTGRPVIVVVSAMVCIGNGSSCVIHGIVVPAY